MNNKGVYGPKTGCKLKLQMICKLISEIWLIEMLSQAKRNVELALCKLPPITYIVHSGVRHFVLLSEF